MTYSYWVGMTPSEDLMPAEEVEFNTFYNEIHIPEVFAFNPGFLRATRYELVSRDLPNTHGPKYLATYHISDERAARQYIRRNDAGEQPSYTPGLAQGRLTHQNRWRLLWREIASHGERSPVEGADEYLWVIGMDVPPGTESLSLKRYNDFYDDIHVLEVMARWQWSSSVRHELFRELAHPAPGAPRFAATYFGSDQVIERRLKIKADSSAVRPLSSGPAIWQARSTMYRLLYRRTHEAVA